MRWMSQDSVLVHQHSLPVRVVFQAVLCRAPVCCRALWWVEDDEGHFFERGGHLKVAK